MISMAVVRLSPSPPLLIQKSDKPFGTVLKLSNSEISVKKQKQKQKKKKKKTPSLQITSSFKNKVFEDECRGIVCYRDESGEITCEGYDEGPRIQPLLNFSSQPRGRAQITDILLKNWLLIAESGDHRNGGAGQNDLFKWDGFSTFFL